MGDVAVVLRSDLRIRMWLFAPTEEEEGLWSAVCGQS